MQTSNAPKFWHSFGPGLLFAGTAVGLSHLVQSTRAGALYGLGLAGIIVLIHVFKYPMFRFGAYYAVVTGESLVSGYRRQGWYAVWLLLATMLVYMFFAVAAVGLLSAALIQNALELDINTTNFAAGILATAATFLMIGRYHWLDRVNKMLIAILAISTLAATIVAIPQLEWAIWPANAAPADLKLMLFIAALGGFMPVSADSSVWQSLWTLAKAEDSSSEPQLRHVLTDFNIGYWGSAFFAICFLVMGASVMNGPGIAPAAQAVPFATQILNLYETGLGAWARPMVAASVISVMLTTTLAGLDALPRVLAAITRVLQGQATGAATHEQLDGTPIYRVYVIGLAGGAIGVLYFFMSTFRALLDFGTTIAFLVAPIIAILNHRAVFGSLIPVDAQPSGVMRIWSWAGILALTLFSFFYLYLLMGGYLT